ncbi:MAG: ATP-dependent Clp protease proteolytic subunit [Eubacteriales bacterium]|nr:ATP-dependent Clp protease proteolytic subunit [Eubacteriales bacterium]MDD4421591.1 ATP-dependent Clp protease proteolytic subunit [Eubacteriales bacterium]HBR31348.1 ATP-dependent Clp protease proteolytic subunit [Clostridiales bacterium]
MIPSPTFIENEGGRQIGYDLFSRLLKDRIVLIFNEINDDLACTVVGQLLYLEAQDPDKDITVYINSPGGSVPAGFAIYDTIKNLKCDVSTICVGSACSMGAFLLAAGTKGKRFGLPNCEVMIHQVIGTIGGQASDMLIATNFAKRTKDRINRIFAENVGKDYETVSSDTERDNWMYAEDALTYGIIDSIIEAKK